MNVSVYTCTFSHTAYEVCEMRLREEISHLMPRIIDIRSGSSRIQIFEYPTLRKASLSYARNPTQEMRHIAEMNFSRPPFRKLRQFVREELTISTNTYAFNVFIKNELHYYLVKVGGKDFRECAEFYIYKDLRFGLPKLSQIYSEPECWSDLGRKGNTVDMIKGALQICQMLYNVNQFKFEDNSNIECGNARAGAPPRKLSRPLSLAHLSLAEKGKTWYEYNFNAFVLDEKKRAEYEKAKERLHDPGARPASFEAFASAALITTAQLALREIYEKTSTWLEFFGSIPAHERCAMLFNWLPEYTDRYILDGFAPTKTEWSIYLDDLFSEQRAPVTLPLMVSTDLIVEAEPIAIVARRWRGGTRSAQGRGARGSRKNRLRILSFSNSFA